MADGDMVVCARCAATQLADRSRSYGYPLNAELSASGEWVCQEAGACARRAATLPGGDDLARLVSNAWEHVLSARLRETGDQVIALQQRQQAAEERRNAAIRAAAHVGIPRQRIAEWSGTAAGEVTSLVEQPVDADA